MIRSMRLSLRFVLPLAAAMTALAYAVVPLVDSLTLRWFVRDLDIRSQLLASTLQEPLADMVAQRSRARILALFNRAVLDERLYALGLCEPDGTLLVKTATFPDALRCPNAGTARTPPSSVFGMPQGPVHVFTAPLESEGKALGGLVLVHDMSFVERRSADTRNYVIVLFGVLGVVISLITVFVAHLSWRGWVEGVRAMLRGEGLIRPFSQPASSELQPLVGDLRAMLRTLDDERRFADDATTTWTPEALRSLLHEQLAGDQVIVVSNREPYIHMRGNEGIEVTAAGQRARDGYGAGHAGMLGHMDRPRERHGRPGDRGPARPGSGPPEHPDYTLRRIWLSKEEEIGYYYGFANEGLWPLCHIAHVRPIFRSTDWEHYVTINQRFADAVVKESKSDDPVVLVQDYHFALLPKMIRKALPKATVITFWHIPWPNPESFGICPWREELLMGMLGSTILGFHTPFHCKNFLETVDRYLETRIEHESSTIYHGGKLTLVESYPISIQWPAPLQQTQLPRWRYAALKFARSHNLAGDALIGIGVDRLDYTKGILERLRAVERLLELHPEMIGRFTFIQIAAPSRSALEDYQALEHPGSCSHNPHQSALLR